MLLLQVLYDPVLIISYLIYYIILCVGYDAGGYIVGGVAGEIYSILLLVVLLPAVMELLVVCYCWSWWCYLCNVGIIGGAGVVGVVDLLELLVLCFGCIFPLLV